MDSKKAWASNLWSFQGPVSMSTVSQTTFKEGRYEVSLPWKPENSQTTTESQKKRFDGFKKWLKWCNPVLRVQQSRGLRKTAHNVKYYLPHHAARREDKVTTPLRVVFGVSSHKDDSLSLNECLLTETNLNPDIFTVLIHFRQHGIAFVVCRKYDPLGFLTPFTVRVKCLFQEMWEWGLYWGEELPRSDSRMATVVFRTASAVSAHHYTVVQNTHAAEEPPHPDATSVLWCQWTGLQYRR